MPPTTATVNVKITDLDSVATILRQISRLLDTLRTDCDADALPLSVTETMLDLDYSLIRLGY